MKISAYSTFLPALEQSYDAILASCRRQGIGKISITAGITGKLIAEPERLRRMRRRLESDGIQVFGMAFPIGHPAMAKYYQGGTTPPDPLPFCTGGDIVEDVDNASLMPKGWRYAENEFGNPIFCCACPDDACADGNARMVGRLASVFDEIWFDDDFRADGDQGAGKPAGSTAACYCSHCMHELSLRVGRQVQREDVLKDQALHAAFTAMKVDQITAVWNASCRAGRGVNPALKMGVMVRWGGEERDGIDIERLLPGFNGDVLFRAGEGYFGPGDYGPPEGPVQSYLSLSHHIGRLPPDAEVLSETTYFRGIRHEDIRKKVAMALAAGAREISYCPCVEGWIRTQDFLGDDLPEFNRWAEAFGNRGRLSNPVVILRTPASGTGSCDPVERARDRMVFPLFNLAGIGTVVTRVPAPRSEGVHVVAVTGRAAIDVPQEWLDGVTCVLDGAALLFDSPLRRRLGIGTAMRGADGVVEFGPTSEWRRDGLLYTKPGYVIVPYIWQDVPVGPREAVLADIRRVVGPMTGAPVLSGDINVFLAVTEREGSQSVMLVNLTRDARTVSLVPPDGMIVSSGPGGKDNVGDIALAPDEILVFRLP